MHDMQLITRCCPVCGNTDESSVFAEENLRPDDLDEFAFASRKLPEYMHHRLIECPACDLLYASPLPEANALFAAYRDAAFDSVQEAGYASRTYAKLLPNITAQLPDLNGALDIGAGDGVFLGELLAAGFTNVFGVEPSAAPIRAATDKVRPLLRQDIFRPEHYQPESLSLITCFQTVEHLYDPAAMCHAAMTLLKPGGAIYLVGHDRRALSAKCLGRKSPIFDVEHLQLFSKKSIRSMLERAGFTRCTVQTILNRYPLHYWAKLLPMPRTWKPGIVSALKFLHIGNVPIPMPAGNIAAIAYKPV